MADIAPNNSDLPANSLSRRLRRKILRGLLVLLVLAIAGWFAWDTVGGRAVQREMSSIAAAGGPLTFTELAGKPANHASAEDAGPYYAAAMQLLCEADQVGEFYGFIREADEPFWPISPDGWVLADVLVSDNRFALGMLDRAAALPACSFDMGVDVSMSYLPLLSKARALAKITSMRTRLLAQQRQGDAAADSLLSGLRMTRIFDREPVFITSLVKIACLMLFAEDLPLVLEFGQPSDAALARLEQGLRQTEASIDVARMWEGERVMSIELQKGAATAGGTTRGPQVSSVQSHLWRPMARAYLLALLQYYDRHITAAKADWPAPLDAAQEAAARQSPLPWNCFVNIIGPSHYRGVVQFARAVAGLRCARAAVLVEQYRRRTGQLPETLDVLAEQSDVALPLDPFSGKPLLYHKTAGGFVVYSADQDRRDDGGRGFDGNTGDWPARVRIRPSDNTSPLRPSCRPTTRRPHFTIDK